MKPLSFTTAEIREINQRIIDGVPAPNVSPTMARVLDRLRFTAAEINAAYAKARRELEEKYS